MNEENQLVTAQTASIVPTEGGNLELSAQNPVEMVECHNGMIEWANRKLEVVRSEARELKEAYEYAMKQKWRTATLKKHSELAAGRVVFFEKMKGALEARYYIVPNFPGAVVFALRTDKENPEGAIYATNWTGMTVTQEVKNPLPAGEGEYKDPNAESKAVSVYTPPNERQKFNVIADEWKELDFPANMARIHVMKAANRSMALKIFDEIQMLPADRTKRAGNPRQSRQPDPVLIGTIICKTKSPYHTDWKRVSFMIAWHIDTKTL
jgi:hypothetical protein